MALESLPLAHARAAQQLLVQYLTRCPGCAQAAAAHVDEQDGAMRLVRFVCPDGCAVDQAAVLAGLAPASMSLTA
jgi:hypothetical protein